MLPHVGGQELNCFVLWGHAAVGVRDVVVVVPQPMIRDPDAVKEALVARAHESPTSRWACLLRRGPRLLHSAHVRSSTKNVGH